MKMKLSDDYYRPRILVLETKEECQIIASLASFATNYSNSMYKFIEMKNGKFLTSDQKDRLLDTLADILVLFADQELLWIK